MAQAGGPGATATVDTTFYRALRWRNIGPFRGGRSAAVSGVRGRPRTFYFGGTGGGVWKTTDGGVTWKNVTDGFVKTGSVGAIAVAESDPNVVYLGMGENPVRSVTTSHGDGVYRSTDGGKTWTHLGLAKTRHISAIRVDPRDPDVVYVAAQGPVYETSSERGVYKSTDGGTTWKKVLYVDSTTGPSDLSMDMTNPRILYAAMWDHHRYPWTIRSGPASSIWKTTDGGGHWTKLTKGLPDHMGKIGVSVSRADPERVWANVEADSGGLYRSDDGGRSWKWVNKDRVLRARAWYYTKVFADPQDANTVYVLNAPVLRSVDAGKSFERVPVPHGDTHDLWIDPDDDATLINGNDGGAIVSFNAGKSWSTEDNQPTAQFYRVNVDDEFPYHVYGGQQDNTPVITASRTMGAGIGWKDWKEGPGCESAYLAFDPNDPHYVYGDCYQGIVEELDRRTDLRRNVQVVPYLGLG
ncbi:MAG TPA: glycosyl hydrolase, partial [Gemmatimonadota bacterium]|nr:glycosyl hydrolase [Gemmatimonadota bacterium]